jgi:hypothetical protein
MKSHPIHRQAALLGVALGVAACDIASFIQDPKPRFEQTWNVPAENTTISVADLIPPSVTIYSTPGVTPEDSSAFRLNYGLTPYSRRIGDDCAACEALNGTNAIKPAFVVSIGSNSALPTEIVSADVVSGVITLQITNGLSFDPLRVRSTPGAQGFLVLTIGSGAIQLGRDSINGATTAFPPGTTLTRNIPLAIETVTGSLSMGMTLNSPVGDAPVPINANGTVAATGTMQDVLLASVSVNVANRTMSSTTRDSIKLSEIDSSFMDNLQAAALLMTITNPFDITGSFTAGFRYGTQPSDVITKVFVLPSGAPQQTSVGLTRDEILTLFGKDIEFTLTGTVNGAGPVTVTPRQAIQSENRLQLKVLTGGGN